jgi:hypothetical protein
MLVSTPNAARTRLRLLRQELTALVEERTP